MEQVIFLNCEGAEEKIKKFILFENFETVIKKQNWSEIEYLNVPCSFDIETSSWYENGEKRACMYEWTFDLMSSAGNEMIMIGRTWEEYDKLLFILRSVFALGNKKRLVLYVHNLSYEFGFLARRFSWKKVFAICKRKPLYALSEDGFEFRCSYLLSGYSLAKLADQIEDDVQKMVGDLDYSLLRHSDTPLTETEIGYCINDVKIVVRYIRKCIRESGDILHIPMTKTGYVRNLTKNNTIFSPRRYHYLNMIKDLTLDVPTYGLLRRGFAGGFVHASPMNACKICRDVESWDECSAYPTMLIAKNIRWENRTK